MGAYIPFLIPVILLAVLCVLARGGFSEAAGWLLRRVPQLDGMTDRETAARALMLVLAADLAGAALTWRARMEDTVPKGYLVRGAYGEADRKEPLQLTLDGEKSEIELPVGARRLTGGEIRRALEEAAEALPDLLLGETPPQHVDHDLVFPEQTGEPPVKISWLTDSPELLTWDGALTESVPEAGQEVVLTAELSLEGETREEELRITVFPEVLSEREELRKEVEQKVEEHNDETESLLYLPDEIGSRRASWSSRGDSAGLMMAFLGMLAAVLLVYSGVKRKEEAAKKREAEMLLDYPHLVNKLVLLIAAGLSMRKAFAKLRDDYRAERKRNGRIRPGYEVIAEAADEMDHGVSERLCYERIGMKAAPAEYRTLSMMLAQNLMKGGGELTAILRREAENAGEERRKRARVRGEEAGTKLLMPMLLELGVVMAVLMVPAFIAFF